MRYARFVYTNDSAVSVDFTLALPVIPWRAGSQGVGGREFSAARVPSSYELRRDHTLAITLRFTETEWPQVRQMLEHGTRSTVITVHLDGVAKTCYLLTPELAQRIEPRRAMFPGDFEIDTEWMTSDGTNWDSVRAYG